MLFQRNAGSGRHHSLEGAASRCSLNPDVVAVCDILRVARPKRASRRPATGYLCSMISSPEAPSMLDTSLTIDVCNRAANARDARFDGVFFVGITTTHIYCRPVCPARISYPDRRRFFGSPAAAERAATGPACAVGRN